MSAIASTAGGVLREARGLLLGAYAAAVGYLAIAVPKAAAGIVAAPALAVMVVNPWWAVVGATWFLAIQQGVGGAGLHLAISDVLIATALLGFFPLLLVNAQWRARLRDARPALLWMAPFAGWLVVLVGAHTSGKGVANSLQYLELTVLMVALGAIGFSPRSARVALYGFLIVTCFTAVLWIGHVGLRLVDNKNPAGQFMVDAGLLSLGLVRRWVVRIPLFALLAVGTLFTESRGAVLGAGIGAIVLLAFRGLGSWRRTVAAIVPLVAVCLIGYNFVPQSLQDRVRTTFSSTKLPARVERSNRALGSLSSAQYSVNLRRIYRKEGIAYDKQHLAFGVGVGNYLTGNLYEHSLTNEPHNVLILNAGEGGVLDDVLFLVMFAGTAFVVIRRSNRSPWAGPALAVQAAILAHGCVDVYWVRGTPVLGWLLVGMAMNRSLDRETSPDLVEAPAPRQRELGDA